MKVEEQIFNIFVNSVLGPCVFIIGMIGNIFGLIVLYRNKLKGIGPIYIYRSVFIADIIYLPQIIVNYMITQFNYDITIRSSFVCKIYQYINFVPDAISPWLLVYISIEKFITITNIGGYKFLLRSKLIQINYIFGLIIFAFIYYIVQPFCFDLININSSDNTTNDTTPVYICYFKNDYLQHVSALFDTIHRVILPFLLMIVFSALLVATIFRSRRRVANAVSSTNNDMKRLKRDIKFAISSFSMNLLFIILNLPLSLMNLSIGQSLTDVYLTVYLFYFSYGCNFYCMLLTNSIFRNEFTSLFIRKKKQNKPISNQQINNNQIIMNNNVRQSKITEKESENK